LAGEHTRGGGCGLIRFNARNLTSVDSRMKVRLKVLPDKLRGGAWPSSSLEGNIVKSVDIFSFSFGKVDKSASQNKNHGN